MFTFGQRYEWPHVLNYGGDWSFDVLIIVFYGDS